MESFLDLSISHCKSNIKFIRNILRVQIIWVIFNISLVCFDWYVFNFSPSKLTCVSFGVMIAIVLWSFIFMLQTWSELKTEKYQLKFLTETHNTKLWSSELQKYIEVRKDYEQLIEQLKEQLKENQNEK